MIRDAFSEQLEKLLPELKSRIKSAFDEYGTQSGYRSVWEDFEGVINPVVIELLTNQPFNIPRNDIIIAKSKSVYPDLKVRYKGKLYAFDVKSGEDGTDPWYDIGRLDTYEEKHLNKYAEEYSIVVRWRNKTAPEVVGVYIEPTYSTVGHNKTYDGILYRPYDGKIRPKPWSEFENNRTQWKTKEEFYAGFEIAKIHRRMRYIVEWYKEMNKKQRELLRKKLDATDDLS